MSQPQSSQKNNKTARSVIMFVIGMFALAYASFPIYNLFCKATGYAGIPKTIGVETNSGNDIGKRLITVRFNADIMKEVQWKFQPLQKQVDVYAGENKMIFYNAENNSDEKITGVATYNITPEKAAQYFNKVQCFCFNEQTLEPHEKVEMPVSFYIDPKIENDPDMADVKTITLSYTFFKANQ
jgi:cytochrome c oxidase assembly protein subunit 11